MRHCYATVGLAFFLALIFAGFSEAQAQSTITIGQTSVLSAGDSDNANLLLAQQAKLAQTATVNSLSFYVTAAEGNLILGIYDATGSKSGPGKLLAQTGSFKTVKGWNTVNVTAPVSLAAGTYWLAYLPSSNGLSFVKQNNSGNCYYHSSSFKNGMPSAWGTSLGRSCSPTTWSFYATLTPGGSTTPAPVAVNGVCGTSNGQILASTPTNLCSTGTASAISGTGPWSWSCAGSNGGTTAQCTAQLAPQAPAPVNGACGSSNGQTLSTTPTNLCSAGTASAISGTGPWTWSCTGSNGGTTASCSAQKTVTPVAVNGVCGSSNGQTLSTTPTNLCSTGTASAISGTGPWSWSCAGINGGTTATCSAQLAPQAPAAVNGVCGSSNGLSLISTPTNLCSTGTASAIAGSGPWSWSCVGSNGGTTASCSAQLASQNSSDPTVGVLPSYDDAHANWVNAGLQSVGGIPDRTTVCATVNPLGGGKDDYTNIQNAINNCPAGEVVQLGAGAFTVKLVDLPIQISTGIVLRGTGNCSGSSSPFCQTSITVSDGAVAYTGGMCGTDASHKVACPNGGPPVIDIDPVSPGYNYSWAQCGNTGGSVGSTSCGAVALTTDAVQGDTTVHVANTSKFSVGEWVRIDEASGAGWVTDPMNAATGFGQIWATSDFLSSSGSPATGRFTWPKAKNAGWDFGPSDDLTSANSPGCWFSYCDRVTTELHKIASIGSGTLTFDDPLTIGFRQSGGHNALVYPGLYDNQSGVGTPISFIQNAGLENVSVLRGFAGGVTMQFCVNCWIKNVDVGYWYGGGINISNSVRSELNNVYVHHAADSVNNGGEYPIALDDASTEMLITNSMTNFAGKGMVARAGGAGSVISYSYFDDTMYDAESGIGDYWVDMSLGGSHWTGQHHILFEGNWADNLDVDHTHGSGEYQTYFRNQGTGLRTPFTDPSNNKVVNDFAGVAYCTGTCTTNPGPLRGAGPSAYNYWFAFVGNVLGLAGETTAANGWTYQGDWNGNRMWMIGWNDGSGGQDPHLAGASGSYIFRHGNFDYVNGAITDWTSGYSTALPNSLYLASKPAFFGNNTWPWIDPAGSTKVYTLPAKARYEAGTPLASP